MRYRLVSQLLPSDGRPLSEKGIHLPYAVGVPSSHHLYFTVKQIN